MATIKEITHDSSTTLSDFYTDLIQNGDGAISIKVAAALGGSVNGVEMDYDAGSTNANTLRETFTFSTPTELRWRFRMDLGGVTNNNAGFEIATVALLTTTSSNFMEIDFDANAGDSGFTLELFYTKDGVGVTSVGSVAFPSSGDTCVEVRATKETADGNNDAEIELFLNGASQFSISNGENFNNFAPAKNLVGFRSSDANVTGTLKYDEFILTDVSGTSLCVLGSHIWLSTDGGATYTNIGDSAWAANVVGGVVVVPGTAYQTIFAAVGTNLYKTINGGTAWTLETAIGYEVDFIDLEKDNTTVFLAKRDAAGTNRASLWDSVGASLSHINTGKSTTGGATSGGDVV